MRTGVCVCVCVKISSMYCIGSLFAVAEHGCACVVAMLGEFVCVEVICVGLFVCMFVFVFCGVCVKIVMSPQLFTLVPFER